MKKSQLYLKSLLSAALVFVYILIVVALLFNLQEIFGQNEEDPILAPIIGLLLFVISATITGSLVLGQPIFFYLEGKKKEAVYLFGLTVSWLVVFLLLAIMMLL